MTLPEQGAPVNVLIRITTPLSSVIPANDTKESMFGHRNFYFPAAGIEPKTSSTNPDSMTTLGHRSILVSRFVGPTLVNYVGPTSTCSLGYRRSNAFG